MGAILKILNAFFSSVCALIQFLLDSISDLIYFIGLLGELIPALPSLFTWLPPVAVSVLLTVFGIVVILRILGR